MSGPKSSRYTLSAEQLKRILEEQERIRKELEEKARQEREIQEAKAVMQRIHKNISRHLAMLKENYGSPSFQSNVSTQTLLAKYTELNSLATTILSVCAKTGLNYAEIMAARTKSEDFSSQFLAMENEYVTSLQNAKMEQSILEGNAIASAMEVSFEQLGIIEEEIYQPAVDALNEMESHLDLDLPEHFANELFSSITQLQSLTDRSVIDNYIAITIEPLMKRIKAHISFKEKSEQIFAATLDRYRALCVQLEMDQAHFDFSASGLSLLRDEVARLEALVNHDAEQAYICQSIDEVLTEMGYAVLGKRHVTKKSGRSFTSKLLTYDDGSVINVTESSTGQITMEIGGVDDHDRMPNANERVALQKKMVQFCHDFQEIEKKLAQRGVVLNTRLSMAPPEEAYAQIINASDYDLVADSSSFTTKHQNASSANSKIMRNE